MEIFSYVVDGKLSHADSLGNKEALSRGAVQYLSAGTGITHAVRPRLPDPIHLRDPQQEAGYLVLCFCPKPDVMS